jgi:Ca2+-binding RTX toxin-like protein
LVLRRLVVSIAALGALLPVADASAATIRVTDGTLTIEAAAGETNVVTVGRTQGVIRVRDTGPPPVAGAGCTSQGANTVECAFAASAQPPVEISLGDGDDRATINANLSVLIDGGDGNDALDADGVYLQASLHGGVGDDTLIGGPGMLDILDGGLGADVMRGGSTATDGHVTFGLRECWVMDGAKGQDSVTYEKSPGPVDVSLDGIANDGMPGEGDNVMPDVEVVRGSPFDDRLVAGAEPVVLYGSGGRDVLLGSPGNDLLFGGGRRDRIDAGAGADCAFGGTGNDRLAGGPGADTLIGGWGADRADGGAGNDLLRMHDARWDLVIGGAGRDIAVIDRRVDRVLGAERRVTRYPLNALPGPPR